MHSLVDSAQRDRFQSRITAAARLTVIVLVLTPAAVASGQNPRVTPEVAEPEEPTPARRSATKVQRANAEARIAKAQAIVSRLTSDAKRQAAGPGWRQAALESLLPLSLAALEQVEQRAVTLDALARAVVEAADDPNLLGDPNTDLVYRPINPCRYIDTRNGTGKIDGIRGYNLTANGAIYGGAAACAPVTVFGVATDDQIAAVAMNVTIVDPSAAPGFVAVKPTAASPTVSLVNWYEAGAAVQVANQGIASMLQDNAVGDEFVMQSSAPVHVIVDLFGAFVAGPRHMFATATGGGPNPSGVLQFFGEPVEVVVSEPSQRVFIIAFNAFGTSGGPAAALNLFVCYQPIPGFIVHTSGNGIAGVQMPASTKTIQGVNKVLQLPVGLYRVGMCGTGGSGWNNNDWGMTSAFVF